MKSSGEKRKIVRDEVDVLSMSMDPSTFLCEPVATKQLFYLYYAKKQQLCKQK